MWPDEVLHWAAERETRRPLILVNEDLKWGSAEGQRSIDNPDVRARFDELAFASRVSWPEVDVTIGERLTVSAAPKPDYGFQPWISVERILDEIAKEPSAQHFYDRWVHSENHEDRRGERDAGRRTPGRCQFDRPEERPGEADHRPAPTPRRRSGDRGRGIPPH